MTNPYQTIPEGTHPFSGYVIHGPGIPGDGYPVSSLAAGDSLCVLFFSIWDAGRHHPILSSTTIHNAVTDLLHST